MTGRIHFGNLIRQLLPLHKRQPVRLWLLRAFTAPLQDIFEDFDLWRNNTRMVVNVNSQVMVFEGYLRKKYESDEIRVVSFSGNTPLVSLRIEGFSRRLQVGTQREKTRKLIPLRGEMRGLFGEADFIVYIPAHIQQDLIIAEIERFKQALINYKIIQNEA